jgi:hypothetical protein
MPKHQENSILMVVGLMAYEMLKIVDDGITVFKNAGLITAGGEPSDATLYSLVIVIAILIALFALVRCLVGSKQVQGLKDLDNDAQSIKFLVELLSINIVNRGFGDHEPFSGGPNDYTRLQDRVRDLLNACAPTRADSDRLTFTRTLLFAVGDSEISDSLSGFDTALCLGDLADSLAPAIRDGKVKVIRCVVESKKVIEERN